MSGAIVAAINVPSLEPLAFQGPDHRMHCYVDPSIGDLALNQLATSKDPDGVDHETTGSDLRPTLLSEIVGNQIGHKPFMCFQAWSDTGAGAIRLVDKRGT